MTNYILYYGMSIMAAYWSGQDTYGYAWYICVVYMGDVVTQQILIEKGK